jgi:hypothetical protein
MRRILRTILWLLLLLTMLPGCMAAEQNDLKQVSNLGYTAFIHVNVVPMINEIVIADQTVLINGSRIVEVGPSSEITIPENATVIDGEGAYLMPGLADMHMHTNQNWDDGTWPVSPLVLYLANGVTTIRDFGPNGEDLTYVLEWRDQIKAGTRVGPTIYSTGKILFVSPLGDPRGLVQEIHQLGFDFLKLYSYLSPEDTRLALAAARELGFYSAGHIPFMVGLEDVLDDGMDEIAHVEELAPEFIQFDLDQVLDPEAWLGLLVESTAAQFDPERPFDDAWAEATLGVTMERVVSLLQQHGAPVCTTMVIDEVVNQKVFSLDAFLARPESAYVPAAYLESLRAGTERHQLLFRGREALARFKRDLDRWILRKLHEAGIPLLLGTDSGILAIVPGYSIHDELRILVDNGFSPYQALATGTVNAAAVIKEMGGEGDFGTVIVGNRADLILVKKNPFEDIATLREPLGVMAAGRWYLRGELDRMTAIKLP